jgi:L-fucono-1,5-lactonase
VLWASNSTPDPNPELIAAVIRLTDLVPELRTVIDYLPRMEPPPELEARHEIKANLRELGQRPQVYFKVSEVLRRVKGRVPVSLDFYRERLDQLWEISGEDRVLYGSDWPTCDHFAPLEKELRLVKDYFLSKGRAVAEKVFWKNSLAAYRWVSRDTSQPVL